MVTVSVKMPTNVAISAIKVVLPVRYEEEDIPKNFPGRSGNTLTLVIDLNESMYPYDGASGTIRDWPADFGAFFLSMKVVDGGSYYLLGQNGEVIGERVENYVPGWIPNDSGDYVEFNVDADGQIRELFVLDLDGDNEDTVDWISR